VSKKTGNPYDGFFACPNRCKENAVHPAAQFFPGGNGPQAKVEAPKDVVLMERLDLIKTMIADLNDQNSYLLSELIAIKKVLEENLGDTGADTFKK
jgi:hypothetical protein